MGQHSSKQPPNEDETKDDRLHEMNVKVENARMELSTNVDDERRMQVQSDLITALNDIEMLRKSLKRRKDKEKCKRLIDDINDCLKASPDVSEMGAVAGSTNGVHGGGRSSEMDLETISSKSFVPMRRNSRSRRMSAAAARSSRGISNGAMLEEQGDIVAKLGNEIKEAVTQGDLSRLHILERKVNAFYIDLERLKVASGVEEEFRAQLCTTLQKFGRKIIKTKELFKSDAAADAQITTSSSMLNDFLQQIEADVCRLELGLKDSSHPDLKDIERGLRNAYGRLDIEKGNVHGKEGRAAMIDLKHKIKKVLQEVKQRAVSTRSYEDDVHKMNKIAGNMEIYKNYDNVECTRSKMTHEDDVEQHQPDIIKHEENMVERLSYGGDLEKLRHIEVEALKYQGDISAFNGYKNSGEYNEMQQNLYGLWNELNQVTKTTVKKEKDDVIKTIQNLLKQLNAKVIDNARNSLSHCAVTKQFELFKYNWEQLNHVLAEKNLKEYKRIEEGLAQIGKDIGKVLGKNGVARKQKKCDDDKKRPKSDSHLLETNFDVDATDGAEVVLEKLHTIELDLELIRLAIDEALNEQNDALSADLDEKLIETMINLDKLAIPMHLEQKRIALLHEIKVCNERLQKRQSEIQQQQQQTIKAQRHPDRTQILKELQRISSQLISVNNKIAAFFGTREDHSFEQLEKELMAMRNRVDRYRNDADGDEVVRDAIMGARRNLDESIKFLDETAESNMYEGTQV